jgi:hypothetical protein
MSNDLLNLVWLLLWALLFGVCAMAFAWGGRAERMGAACILAQWLIHGLIELTVPEALRPTLYLINDGWLAIAFLLLALSTASIWLGGAMMFQSAQFSLHAFYILNNRPRDLLHFTVNNTDAFGILVCLALAVLATRKRVRAAAMRTPERAT